ncbi:MAG: SPASM domain-containing protein [Crocinitomicaceae bacterium]|nr:SPASM domain-containing protein [Crocinitomicaceae bacterium]
MNGRTKGILRTTTTGRVWNLILLKTSFRLSILLRKPIHWGKPLAVSIEPTTACNLRCPQCPSGLRQFSRPTGNLRSENNLKILDGIGNQLQYVNYYFQGEPFIHPNFLDLVRQAADRKIYVVTSTNAHFITEKNAKYIVQSGLGEAIISIDGTTQESYVTYRVEGKLKKVLEGTRHLTNAKKLNQNKGPHIVFQFLVTKKNEHQIDELYKLAKEYNVDEVRLKTLQVYDLTEEGKELIPENENYSRYKKDDEGNFSLKNKFKNQCWRMWSSCVITWDGKIVPCCFDKDASLEMGNILDTDFKKIWKSQVYKGFRQAVHKNRAQIEICKNCSEGSKVWA